MADFLETFRDRVILVVEFENYIRISGIFSKNRLNKKPAILIKLSYCNEIAYNYRLKNRFGISNQIYLYFFEIPEDTENQVFFCNYQVRKHALVFPWGRKHTVSVILLLRQNFEFLKPVQTLYITQVTVLLNSVGLIISPRPHY